MDCYVACICEGGAESAIINILLDNHKLKFEREDLLEEDIIMCRSGKEFARRYLAKSFDKPITIYRILDSRRENFKIDKAYKNKINIINVVTSPEIEMLIILKEDKYNEYIKAKQKPSEFCKSALKMKNVKKQNFMYDYFNNVEELITVLQKYKSITKRRKGEFTIFDLLKRLI